VPTLPAAMQKVITFDDLSTSNKANNMDGNLLMVDKKRSEVGLRKKETRRS